MPFQKTIPLIKKSISFSITIVLALVTLMSVVAPAAAQKITVALGGNVPTARSQQGPTDPVEMEAFLDDLLGKEMGEYHIAGAAVSVVKDGKLFFAKGYGYADLENKIPVDPEQTVFRIGSVTKLFTATAVMQLVEQGKLDLDADINTYLDFHIPDTYPQPITLKHLLTHTSGFEERLFELMTLDAGGLVPAREWLVSHMHARVRPPGESVAYSDYNASLAGYIVSLASGQPYDQYIKEHILDPLGIKHSSVSSPAPPDMLAHMSLGYTYEDGAYQIYPDYLGQLGMIPTGGMAASATDMARFMIAHLQDGLYSDANIPGARILKETTAQEMHTTQYTPDPRLRDVDYGFFDFSDSGQRTIGHSGEAPPMNSLLLLLPDQDLGVFVAYNSDGGGELTNQHLGFQRAFFDHYYPVSAAAPIQPPSDFAERASRFLGNYRITRGSYTTSEKVLGLLIDVEISNPGDGTLLLTTPYGEWRLIEVDPLYFRSGDDQFGFIFREDEQGRIAYMFTDIIPEFAFEKLNWYEAPGFNIALALACLLIFLSMIPVAVIRFIRNRKGRTPTPLRARLAYWLVIGISILNLMFVIGLAVWGNPAPVFGTSMIYKIVLGLGVLSAVLTVGALFYCLLVWKDRYWGAAFRVYYILVTIAALAFIWFLNFWNLLGWRL